MWRVDKDIETMIIKVFQILKTKLLSMLCRATENKTKQIEFTEMKNILSWKVNGINIRLDIVKVKIGILKDKQ